MVRVSAISFLNTVPLLRGFDRTTTAEKRELEMWFTTPAACADQLRSRRRRWIIPHRVSAHPRLVVVGDAAIAPKAQYEASCC